MTHAELVLRAVRWLRGTEKCGVVFAEMVTSLGETPDAIGWRGTWSGASSILVECKTSVGDLRADALKASRLNENSGPGRQRYVMIPHDMRGFDLALGPTLDFGLPLLPGWGLLVTGPRQVVPVRRAVARQVYGHEAEILMLVSAVRRHRLNVPFDARAARWESMVVTRARVRDERVAAHAASLASETRAGGES
jgi:hypothetical protein